MVRRVEGVEGEGSKWESFQGYFKCVGELVPSTEQCVYRFSDL
jgi:hypothetical protein